MAKKITVQIDGTERALVIDFNALAKIEEITGKNMTDMEAWKSLTASEIRTVLWCGLLREWPEATVEDAGKLDVEALGALQQATAGSADPLAAAGSKPGLSESTI